jgi:hypothetical protein
MIDPKLIEAAILKLKTRLSITLTSSSQSGGYDEDTSKFIEINLLFDDEIISTDYTTL